MNIKALSLLLLIALSLTVVRIPEARAEDPHGETGSFGFVPPPVNFTQFWSLFNRYSAWDLEANTGSGWFSVKQDLTVDKNYTDPGTCKINLIFSASYSGDYRLTFGIDLRVKNYTYRENRTRYTLEYQNYTVFFDFSDLLEVPQLQFSHGVKEVDGKDVFWFRARRDDVPLGAYLELDPTFGFTSQGGSFWYLQKADKIACKFTSPVGGSARTVSMSVYIYSSHGGLVYGRMAIYFNGDNYPDNLKGETEQFTITGGGRWYTATMDPLALGTNPFWLVVCVYDQNEDEIRVYYDGGSSGQAVYKADTTGSFKNPFVPGGTPHDRKISIYLTYSFYPTIGDFEASSSTVYADEWFNVNCSLADPDGVEYIKNGTLALNGSVVLAWDNATGNFTINQDPNSFCTLNSTACIMEEISSTALNLSWRIKLTSSYPTGSIDVLSSSTVYDIDGFSGSGSESGVFTFALRTPDYAGGFTTGRKKTFFEEVGIPGILPPDVMVIEAQYGTIALVLIMGGAVIYYLRKPRGARELWKAQRKKAPRRSRSKKPKPDKNSGKIQRNFKKQKGRRSKKW